VSDVTGVSVRALSYKFPAARQALEGGQPGSYGIAPVGLEPDSQSKRLGSQIPPPPNRLGAPNAITAMAYHLARLIYRMLKFGHAYVDKGIEYYESKHRKQQPKWLQKQAKALNLQLSPLTQLPA
jgi:hypothetical protein